MTEFICYTSVRVPSCNVSGVLEASADTNLGCYDEYGDEAVFDRDSATSITNLSSVAPDGCREECRKYQIYSFAGLWVGIPF